MRKWQLRKAAEKRFRTGHPWVFSNELTQSPKGHPPGELIELVSESNQFLAFGYGNPNSLIAFRALSTTDNISIDASFFSKRFSAAMALRTRAGLAGASHRLVFAEGDYLPGLIIDRYLVADHMSQIFVIQSSTAGMDKLTDFWMQGLHDFVNQERAVNPQAKSWENTVLITAHTSKSRALENVPVETKKVVKSVTGVDPSAVDVLIESSTQSEKPTVFSIDIIGGQKTGFFLDQRQNIKLLLRNLKSNMPANRPLRVLDLCCYVGQWSTQIAEFAEAVGQKVELHLFDTSDEALKLAAQNVARYGGHPAVIKGDVLKSLSHLQDRYFDVVICDPPAFIKKKKDIPTGSQAYLKLNKEARKKVANNGLFVSCSCSGLFASEDFKKMLGRVSYGEDYHIQWIEQGFHSADHPQRLEFPEGTYLKCMIGVINEN